MNTRELHINSITKILATLRTEVELRNSINLTDLNIHAENFYRDLFNLVYGLGLSNMNARSQNAAYIDLLDEKNKIAIQVTSDNTAGKISDSIEGFLGNEKNKGYKLKVLLIAKQAKDYKKDFTFGGKYEFDHEKDVIDIERLLKDIVDKDTDSIQKIAEFLQKETSTPNWSGARLEVKILDDLIKLMKELLKPKPNIINKFETQSLGSAGYVENQHNYFGNTNPASLSLPLNIPPPSGKFIGREDKLGELQAAYDCGERRLGLFGFGGTGKSSTCLEFAKRIGKDFPAQIFVDLQAFTNPLSAREAMFNILRQFHSEVSANLTDAQLADDYRKFIQKQPTLIVLDNVKDYTQIADLLRVDACILITSRMEFAEIPKSVRLAEMLPEDALELLYSITPESRFDGKGDELAKLAGYVPMALKPLAIMLKRKFSRVESIIVEYSQKRLELTDTDHNNLSVEASFALTYDQLAENLKQRWRRLAVFPGDFEEKAAAAVCGLKPKDINPNLSTFYECCLLEEDEKSDTRQPRFRLHDLARDYAITKLDEKERFRAEFNLSRYYGKLLATHGKATLENLALFDLERRNIEHGFRWIKDKAEIDELFAQVCDHYTGYSADILHLRLHMREYISWLETAISTSKKFGDKAAEGNHLGNLGNVYGGLGEDKKAIDYYEKALVISREIGNKQDEGNHLGNLGTVYQSLGEYEKAIDFYEKALVISREICDRRGEGNQLGNLGNVYGGLGEDKKAIELHEKALVISTEIGDREGEGHDLGSLGNAYLSLGEHKKAIDFYEKALVISREIGDRQGEGGTLGNLGNAYLNLGDKEKAIDLHKESIAILEAIESPAAEMMRWNLAIAEGR